MLFPARIPNILFTVCFLLISATALEAQTDDPGIEVKWYRVVKALSGDGFELESGAVVNYASVKAPDLLSPSKAVENYAKESFQFNRDLVGGKKVRLEWDYRIRKPNGEYLAYVFLEDGTFVNLEILKEGYAKLAIEAPNFEHADDLREAAVSARRNDKGLWKYEGDSPSKDFVFIGNKMKKEFHTPDCPELSEVPQGHRKVFNSAVAARSEGYSYCKRCKKAVSQETDLF